MSRLFEDSLRGRPPLEEALSVFASALLSSPATSRTASSATSSSTTTSYRLGSIERTEAKFRRPPWAACNSTPSSAPTTAPKISPYRARSRPETTGFS
ncbi:hypothetical protein [Streptomyces mirabilis]|uniref:hypothetical protein n=1 Tax=Streptomyces mirabilis TaxID=68239 RepID=UPI0036768016